MSEPTTEQLWALINHQTKMLAEIEEHCNQQVDDWKSSCGQDVLDIINQEGEWAVDE